MMFALLAPCATLRAIPEIPLMATPSKIKQILVLIIKNACNFASTQPTNVVKVINQKWKNSYWFGVTF
jgi:signal transduction histidine kinase